MRNDLGVSISHSLEGTSSVTQMPSEAVQSQDVKVSESQSLTGANPLYRVLTGLAPSLACLALGGTPAWGHRVTARMTQSRRASVSKY